MISKAKLAFAVFVVPQLAFAQLAEDPSGIDGPTGAFFLEAQTSRNLGTVFRFGLTEADLFSTGVAVEVSAAQTEEGTEKKLILGKDFDLGSGKLSISGNFIDRAYDVEDYDFVRKGLSLGYTIPVSAVGSLRFGGFAREDTVADTRSGTSPIIAADEGTAATTGVELSYAVDTRDNALVPSSGVRAEIGVAVASVDGVAGWRSVYTDVEGYVPIGAKPVLKLSLSAGNIEGLNGRDVSVTERAFAGNDAPRGFTPGTFGPTDGDSSLGGKSYVFSSIEVFSPILEDRTKRLYAGAFVDVGSVWALDNVAGAKGTVDDDFYMRSSAGLSLSYLTQFGRIEASAAKPLRARSDDKTETFFVRLETRF